MYEITAVTGGLGREWRGGGGGGGEGGGGEENWEEPEDSNSWFTKFVHTILTKVVLES